MLLVIYLLVTDKEYKGIHILKVSMMLQ